MSNWNALAGQVLFRVFDAVLPEVNGVTETATVLWRLLMFPITTPRTMTTASVMIAPRNLGLRLGRGGRGP